MKIKATFSDLPMNSYFFMKRNEKGSECDSIKLWKESNHKAWSPEFGEIEIEYNSPIWYYIG